MAARSLFQRTFAALLASKALGQSFVGVNGSETSVAINVPPPAGLSSSCSSTFSNDVTCDAILPSIAFSGVFPSSEELSSLCQDDCRQSLSKFQNTQQQSCATDTMVVSGEVYPVTATVDTLLWTYNYTCLQDPKSGEYCAPVFDAWANGNGSDKSCSYCVLATYQQQLSNALGYDSDLVQGFKSLTSSCQETSYPITSPPANTVDQTATPTTNSTAPTAARSCSSMYTVKANEDCHSISKAQQVSTSEMLYLSELEGGCADFPSAGKQLCMPHTCKIYTVQTNDTCYDIAAEHNNTFSISQLVSWNIDISRGCDNLELLVGNQICVSYPGEVAAEPSVSVPASTQTQAPVPTDVVDGTNTRCGKYYHVRGGDTCASITQQMGISLPDFYFLNPEINSTSCNNLFLGYSYCVQAVGNINTYPGYGGKPTNPCVGGTTVPPSSCYASTYSTASLWTFPSANQSATAGNDTQTSSFVSHVITPISAYPNTVTGMADATPGPHADSMVAGCTDFYAVQSGDGCYDIAQRWSIPLADLYAWNPALNGDCSGLIAGDFICTANNATSSETTTTAKPSPTPTGDGTSPPGPTQSGIPSECNKWVLQKDGVYCYDMAQTAGISLDCLYKLNPALDECSALFPGYAYCIGTASKVCS